MAGNEAYEQVVDIDVQVYGPTWQRICEWRIADLAALSDD